MIRIAVVGIHGVGKTCLLVRYCNDFYHANYSATIDDSYRMQVPIPSAQQQQQQFVTAELFNCNGLDAVPAVRSQVFTKADGFVVCLCPLVADSYKYAEQVMEQVCVERKCALEQVPWLFVVTQSDDIDTMQHKVPPGEIQAFIDKYGHLSAFVRTSAKNGTHCDEPAKQLVVKIVQTHQQLHTSSKCAMQ